MLVWLQHEKDCFDNPTTYLPYMEGKADSKLCCKHSAISCSSYPAYVVGFLYRQTVKENYDHDDQARHSKREGGPGPTMTRNGESLTS